jgi:hypothetical protein
MKFWLVKYNVDSKTLSILNYLNIYFEDPTECVLEGDDSVIIKGNAWTERGESMDIYRIVIRGKHIGEYENIKFIVKN